MTKLQKIDRLLESRKVVKEFKVRDSGRSSNFMITTFATVFCKMNYTLETNKMKRNEIKSQLK